MNRQAQIDAIRTLMESAGLTQSDLFPAQEQTEPRLFDLLKDDWCVAAPCPKVVAWLNEKSDAQYNGIYEEGDHYGVLNGDNEVQNTPFGRVLTESEFLELAYPEPKKPILTTHDGVEVYDPEQVVYWLSDKTYTRFDEDFAKNIEADTPLLWFFTPQARAQYILLNTKSLSIQEVADVLESWRNVINKNGVEGIIEGLTNLVTNRDK